MVEPRIITEAEALRWRLLSYVFHHTGQPFSDWNLSRSENDAFKDLQAEGAVEFTDRWAITPQGRKVYYQLRACQVPGCSYLEARGSRQGDYIDGKFVCPVHGQTEIGRRAAREAFAAGGQEPR